MIYLKKQHDVFFENREKENSTDSMKQMNVVIGNLSLKTIKE